MTTTAIDKADLAGLIARALDLEPNNMRSVTFHPGGLTVELFTGNYQPAEPFLTDDAPDEIDVTCFSFLEDTETRRYRIVPA